MALNLAPAAEPLPLAESQTLVIGSRSRQGAPFTSTGPAAVQGPG